MCSRMRTVIGIWVLALAGYLTFAGGRAFAAGQDLDQCQNGVIQNLGKPCGVSNPDALVDPTWANGNINSSNSQYREGDGIPYRFIVTGLSDGPHTVKLEYDFTQGGKFAIDRLTRPSLTQAQDDCAIPGQPAFANCVFHSFSTSNIPGEVSVVTATQPALAHGGNLVVAGKPTLLSGLIPDPLKMTAGVPSGQAFAWGTFDANVTQSGASTGNSTRSFSFTFSVGNTVDATKPCNNNCAVVFSWTGHIASQVDWGQGKGAASISGSPFHMRVLEVDGSGGNQDRSVQLSAIIQTLELRKACVPSNDTGLFNLAMEAGGSIFATKNNATCDGVAVPDNSTGLFAVDIGNVTLSETAGSNTNLSNYTTTVSCPGTTVSAVSGTTTRSATVSVPDGGVIVCTFTNTLKTGTLILKKHVDNGNGGTATASNWKLCYDNDDNPIPGDASDLTPPVCAAGSEAGTTYHIPPNTYYITEVGNPSVPNGYSFTGFSVDCTGQSLITSITVGPDDVKTCQLTNDDNPATLTVLKHVISDNGGNETAGDFTLHVKSGGVDVSASPASPQPGSESGTIYTLNAGTYVVSENDPAPLGYANATTDANNLDCNGSGSIPLAVGDNKSCRITNDDIAPTITLIKEVQNNHNGNNVPGDFTLKLDGSGVAQNVAQQVTANAAHTITEDSVAGYEFLSITKTAGSAGVSCPASLGGSVTLAEGQSITCKITNRDIAPTITLVKEVQNNHNGNNVAGDFTLKLDGSAVTQNVAQQVTANAAHTITEDSVAGYEFVSITKTAGSDGVNCPASLGGSVTLAEGQSITCKITNRDIAPTITLIKEVQNNHGGTKNAGDFTLKLDGNAVTQNVAQQVTANADHTITEDSVTGYEFVSITKTAGSDGVNCPASLGGSVTLAEGQSITCKITNRDIAPTLRVIKNVINNNGGGRTASDFTLHVKSGGVDVTASPASPQAGSETGTVYTLSAGTYVVSENDPTPLGYSNTTTDANNLDCDGSGSITLAVGENKSCRITNDDIAPSLTLIKHVTNDNGGNATPANWTLTANGGAAGTLSGPGPTVSSGSTFKKGTYNLSESGPGGYAPSAWSCSKNGGAAVEGSSITLDLADSATCEITNDDIAPKLTVTKRLAPSDDPGKFNLKIDNLVFDNGGAGFGDGGSTGAQTLTANVSYGFGEEVTPNTNTSLSDYGAFITCRRTDTNTSVPFTNNNNGTGSITLGPGDDITCTITNSKLGTVTIIKDSIPDDPQDFHFTGTSNTATGISPFDLDDDTDIALPNTTTITGLQPGNYTVTEGAYANFDLTALNCQAAGVGTSATPSMGARTASITIAAGGIVTCTFQNTKRGDIIVRKVTDPSGVTQVFHFDANGGTDPAYQDFSLTDGQENKQAVRPGNYSVTELPAVGFDLTNITCSNGHADFTYTGATTNPTDNFEPGDNTANIFNHGPGETVTCVFTNTRRPMLILTKIARFGEARFPFHLSDGQTPTDISVRTAAPWTDPNDPTIQGTIGTGTFFLAPGHAYDLQEDLSGLPDWYMNNVTCTFNGTPFGDQTVNPLVNPPFPRNPIPPDTLPITHIDAVQYLDVITCTYTNTQEAIMPLNKLINGCEPNANENGNKCGDYPPFTFNLYAHDPLNPANDPMPGGATLIVPLPLPAPPAVTDPPFPGGYLASVTAPPRQELPGPTGVPFSLCEMNIPDSWENVSWRVEITPFGFNKPQTITHYTDYILGEPGQDSYGVVYNPDYFFSGVGVDHGNRCINVVIPLGTDKFEIFVNNVTGRGRMTGGGSAFATGNPFAGRVTHGFELHCEENDPPNHLEINWDGNRFHLESLDFAKCSYDRRLNAPNPPAAGFNTYEGIGTGRLNGEAGYKAYWVLTDQGEPGTSDTVALKITNSAGTTTVLQVGSVTVNGGGNITSSTGVNLTFGNQQAHK